MALAGTTRFIQAGKLQNKEQDNMKYGKHFAAVSVLVLLGSVVTYFILTAVFTLPDPASTEAARIEPLFEGHFALISFLFALVVVFML